MWAEQVLPLTQESTTGAAGEGGKDHHLPLGSMGPLTWFSSHLPWSPSQALPWAASLPGPYTVFHKAVSSCLPPSTPLDHLIWDYCFSFLILLKFQFQIHTCDNLLGFPGCPTSWSQPRPASHSSSTAQLASTLLLLALSEGPGSFVWVVSVGWS